MPADPLDPEVALREAHMRIEALATKTDTATGERLMKDPLHAAIDRLARAMFRAGKHHSSVEVNMNERMPEPSWLPKETP